MTMTSNEPRAAAISAATRSGSRISTLSGESVSETTFIPDEWAEAISTRVSARAALGLVAPAVGDGAHGVDARATW